MDSTSTAIVIVVALLVLVVVAAFIVFRKQAKVKLNTPLGNLDLDASNKDDVTPKPSISIADAESTGGGILAEDNKGDGVDIRRVKVADDIITSSSSQRKK